MPNPIRKTCIQIIQYEKDSIEIVTDEFNQQGLSKIRFRRFLILKVKSLLHEFEILNASDYGYLRDMIIHTSYFKKLKKFITIIEEANESQRQILTKKIDNTQDLYSYACDLIYYVNSTILNNNNLNKKDLEYFFRKISLIRNDLTFFRRNDPLYNTCRSLFDMSLAILVDQFYSKYGHYPD